MRRKWKNDLDIWISHYNNLVKNKTRYVNEYGEDYYRQNMAKAFNTMKHCQDSYNDLNGIIFELGRQVSAIDHQISIKNAQLAQLGSEPETPDSTAAKKPDQEPKRGSTKTDGPSLFGEKF